MHVRASIRRKESGHRGAEDDVAGTHTKKMMGDTWNQQMHCSQAYNSTERERLAN